MSNISTLPGTKMEISGGSECSHPRLLLRGLDSLYVAYFIDNSQGRIDFPELEYQKERLRNRHGTEFEELTLGSETFALRPFGKNPYLYVLSNEAFEVRLSEHLRPACYVQFFSEFLWSARLDGAEQRINDWFLSLDLDQTRQEKVSRADWAFDFEWSVVAIDPDHIVSRAIKECSWRERGVLQSVQLGTGDIVVRVYDKIAEIEQQSGKVFFAQLWGDTTDVTRIEYQVRGKRLKQAGIISLDDLRSYQNDLLRELATNHTSLRAPTRDSNRSRWPLHKLWSALVQEIATLPQTGLVCAIDPQAAIDWREHCAIRSIYGYTKQLAALRQARFKNENAPSFDATLERLADALRGHHEPTDWPDEVTKRIQAIRLGR